METYDGRLVTAFAFVSSPLFMLPKEVTPTEAYVAVLRDGARDNYLDPLYQVGVRRACECVRAVMGMHAVWRYR